MQSQQKRHRPQRTRAHAAGTPNLKRRLRGDAKHLSRTLRIATLHRLGDFVVPVGQAHHAPQAFPAELRRTLVWLAPEAPVFALASQPALSVPCRNVPPEVEGIRAAVLGE